MRWRSWFFDNPWNRKNPTTDHKPTINNKLGLYGFFDKKTALEQKPCRKGYLLGEIEVWGDCVKHIRGLRAENAKILKIFTRSEKVKNAFKKTKKTMKRFKDVKIVSS